MLNYLLSTKNLGLSILISLFLLVPTLHSIEIRGIGEASTPEQAKQMALSDLSNSISVTIKSSFSSNETQKKQINSNNREENFESFKNKMVQSKSESIILGAKFNITENPNTKTYTVEVVISSDKLPVYMGQLNSLNTTIRKNYSLFKDSKQIADKKKYLEDISEKLEDYDMLRIIAISLGAKNVKDLDITEAQIDSEMSNLNLENYYISRLDWFVENIIYKDRDLNAEQLENKVYIQALTKGETKEATEYGKLLKKSLDTILKGLETQGSAKFIMKGTYQFLDGRLDLNIKVNDMKKIVFSKLYSDYQSESESAVEGGTASIQTEVAERSFSQQGSTFKNSIGVEFVKISAGSFEMGCSFGDSECFPDEKPQHKVKIAKSFYMGKYEVTQGQWMSVMGNGFFGIGGNNPSRFSSCGDSCPVENVSWNEVQDYIQKLCKKENMDPCKYRLPTEAEWEYAARAGKKTRYYWGDRMEGSYAWYSGNSKSTTHPVGEKKPNAWGLYDMIGNVWEYVQDWYDSNFYAKSQFSDPKAPESGEGPVLRGGSWLDPDRDCRLSARIRLQPDEKYSNRGFRLVLLP
jgi:formylglycine-generating enzyme required for sulfatase activity